MNRLGPGVTPEGHSACVALVGLVAWQLPSFAPVLTAHLEEMDGEVLPHLVMAAYEQKAEALLSSDPASVVGLLKLLEQAAIRGVGEVDDLVFASFVENLPYPGESAEAIRSLLGPKLRSMLKHGI